MNTTKLFLLMIICFAMLVCAKHPIILSGKTMGTTYSIKIVDKNGIIKNQILLQSKIDSLLTLINQHLSTYINNSEINIFNQMKSTQPFYASPLLIEILKKAIYHYNLSEGSFDITVQPLVEAWGFSSDTNHFDVPNSNIIDSLLIHSGSDKLIIDQSYIYKTDPNIQIDMSAIAKGWGVDQIGILLDSMGINNYLIEIGGEILISGGNIKGSQNWEIGIRTPDNLNDSIYSIIKLTDQAIATSGSYQNYFTLNGIEYSHLINPKTGYPIQHELVSATVIAPKCTDADAMATAVMVKGFDLGLDWINSLQHVEALLIIKNTNGHYSIGKSKGFNF